MFMDKDVFSVVTNIANKGNFDIVIFNSVYTDLKPDVFSTEVEPTFFDRNHKPNLVLFQPDLGYYNIAPDENLGQIHKERYSRFLILAEDDIACNIIFNTAKSAKFIAKYGYIYINNDGSFSKRQQSNAQDVRNYLYILDPLIDFSLDFPKNKKVLVNFIIFLFQKEYLKDLLNYEYDSKLFNSCLNRILNCKYISDELKNEVRIRGKKLSFIKYNF